EEPSHAAAARRLIGETTQVLATETMTPTLYGGFAGIAWALARLRAWKIVDVGDESFTVIDKALASYLDRDQWRGAVELVYGVTGYLVYALARLPHPEAVRIIERGLHALEVSAETTADGITWFVPASHLHSTTLERAPEGCYNLGVSHGTPGIFSVLAEIHRLGIDPPRTRRLLEGSVR